MDVAKRESEDNSQESDSDSESNEDSSTSSSSSSSDSDSDSESNSSELSSSSDESVHDQKPVQVLVKPPVPPGRGTERTHLRNQRKIRAKKLRRLVEESILPRESTFADLTAYEEKQEYAHYHVARSPQSPKHTSQSWSHEMKSLQTNNLVATKVEEAQKIAPKDEEARTVPPRRIDVAAVSRFIKAGLVGNDGYDRAREEARARGKEKTIVSTETQNEPITPAFVPRTIASKKPKTLHVKDTKWEVVDDYPSCNQTVEDPLIAGFYEQVELAAKHRQSKAENTSMVVNGKSPDTNSAKVVIRAFECEPEWCGMVETREGEEAESVEIDPPSLPFVDNYTPRKRSRSVSKPAPSNVSPESFMIQPVSGLSEVEILALPKLEKPIEGMGIYFKSMFLHPSLFEPVVQWRWGEIIGITGETVTIDIQGPIFKSEDEDEEMEEGEIQAAEETFVWTDIIDVRRCVP